MAPYPYPIPHDSSRHIESLIRPAQLDDARTVQTTLRRAPSLAQDQGEVATWNERGDGDRWLVFVGATQRPKKKVLDGVSSTEFMGSSEMF